jgi:hypothetical protein
MIGFPLAPKISAGGNHARAETISQAFAQYAALFFQL